MQCGDKYGALHGKAELPPFQHLFQYSIDAKPLPQAPEQQRASDPAGCDPACIDIGQNDAALCVTCDRGGQSVEFATCGQHILAAQSLDRALPDSFALAHALDQVKIAVAARDSFDDIHGQVVTACTRKINQTASHRQNVVSTPGFGAKSTHRKIRYLRSRVPSVFRQHCSTWVWIQLNPLRLELELMLNPSEKDHRLLLYLIQSFSAWRTPRIVPQDARILIASIESGTRDPALRPKWKKIIETQDRADLVSYILRLSHVVLKREWERVKHTQ